MFARSLFRQSLTRTQPWMIRSLVSTAERPFKILGVQQIAIGSVTDNSKLWVDIFGVSVKEKGIKIETENVIEDILDLNGVEIDLMRPIDENKSPKVHVPPLNHIGLWVDDLETSVNWMTENGVRMAPGGIRVGAAGHKVAFLHPKSNDQFPISGNGVLIELVQAPPEVIASHK